MCLNQTDRTSQGLGDPVVARLSTLYSQGTQLGTMHLFSGEV